MTDKKETQVSDKDNSQQTLILEVEEVIEIPDGIHEGIISDLKHRNDPFGYIDIYIKEKETGANLKFGYPDKITKNTTLGKFLANMGVSIEVGVKINLNEELLTKEVTFGTLNEETDKGVFAKVLGNTVKPLR